MTLSGVGQTTIDDAQIDVVEPHQRPIINTVLLYDLLADGNHQPPVCGIWIKVPRLLARLVTK